MVTKIRLDNTAYIFTQIRTTKAVAKNCLLTEKIIANRVRLINTARTFFCGGFLNERILRKMNLLPLTNLTNHAPKAQDSYRPNSGERCIC